VALFLVGLGLSYGVTQWVPRAFVPDEDQGWGIVVVQAPAGASLEYTKKINAEIQTILATVPEMDTVFAIGGFSFGGNASNRSLIFFGLKPYSERRGEEHSAQAVLNRLRGPFAGIMGAVVIPFLPPPVQGLGSFGGFQYVLQDQSGHTLEELASITRALVRQ